MKKKTSVRRKRQTFDFDGPDANHEYTEEEIRNEAEFHNSQSASLNKAIYLRGLKSGSRRPFTLTQEGNAKRFVLYHGNEALYHNGLRKWLVWNKDRWRVDSDQAIMRMARDTVKRIHEEAELIEDTELRKDVSNHALRSESHGQYQAMIRIAQSDLPVSPDELDADPWLLNCLNRTLDLKTGRLGWHRKVDRITKIAPAEYDAKAPCPLWMKFLARIMDNNKTLISYLQKAVGYALTGDTREQVFFLLIGLGDNGKSTFLETIREILGDYARDTPFHTFLRNSTSTIRNDIARLEGARFVTASEPEKGKQLSEAVIKVLTGEDKVTARFLYREFNEFKTAFKIFLAANHNPDITGTEHAIWRRVRLIPFLVQIPKEEQDDQLKEKLLREREGILRWAVEGCRLWQKERLGYPPEIKEAVEQYRKDMDTFGAFLEECCILGDEERVQSKNLYSVYRQWCKLNYYRPESHKSFGTMIASKGIGKRKGAPVVYLGIGINQKWLDQNWTAK